VGVIVIGACPEVFVVADDERRGFGQEQSNPGVTVGLAVGAVDDHLMGAPPAITRAPAASPVRDFVPGLAEQRRPCLETIQETSAFERGEGHGTSGSPIPPPFPFKR